MAFNGLLKNVPKGIKMFRNSEILKESRGHDLVVMLVGGMWTLWILLVPLSRFPITMRPTSFESLALPDYASGTTYTQFRKKYKSFDFI